MDEVAKNSIWTEHCKKEKQALKLNEAFAIANPNKSTIYIYNNTFMLH